MRKYLLIVPIICLIIILSLHFFGKSNRTFLKIEENPQFCNGNWHGLKGRILISFSRYLHFLAIHESRFINVYQQFPIKTPDTIKTIKDSISEENLLWVAVETGFARKIFHIIPEKTLPERIEVAKSLSIFNVKQGEPYIVRNNVIYGHYRNTPRYILSLNDLKSFDEPVVIFLHPSFFEFDENPEDVFNALKSLGIDYDSLSFCIPEGYGNKMAIERLQTLKWMIEKDI